MTQIQIIITTRKTKGRIERTHKINSKSSDELYDLFKTTTGVTENIKRGQQSAPEGND